MQGENFQFQFSKSNPAPFSAAIYWITLLWPWGRCWFCSMDAFYHNRRSGETYLIWYKSGRFKGRGDGVIKQMKKKVGLCYCGDVTYICIEEECWSLSNVGNGQRTRQVTLAQKPQRLTVIFSLAEFSTVRCSLRSGELAALIDAEIRFDSCCILQEESQSIWWEPGPESH